ncbi:MAG: hypothetical protein HY675_04240 [Chloroflexi bacterium]|nr:hypothetical protein [Chloroflexota bacterium]
MRNYQPIGPRKALVDLGHIAVVLALNRLFAPEPFVRRWRLGAKDGLGRSSGMPGEQLHDMRLGRALDALFPHLGTRWVELAAQAIRRESVDLAVLHFDLTSCYFEGESMSSTQSIICLVDLLLARCYHLSKMKT